jgi:hypothetical protein
VLCRHDHLYTAARPTDPHTRRRYPGLPVGP